MILVFVEHDRGKLNELSLQALTLGRQVAQQTDGALQVVTVGEAARALLPRVAEYGVGLVHLAQDSRLDDYAPGAWAQCVVDRITALQPQVVLAAGSDRGNEVLAHVAARADLPLAANCTEVTPGEPFLVTRQRWGGSLLEDAKVHGAVKLLTLAPHAIQAEATAASQAPAIQEFTPALNEKDFRVRVTARVETTGGKVSLADAKVVVGGGRGVGSAEGFAVLETLAELLGGVVGCSRAVTSLGWRPHLDQVGQTGTRIAPEIYIACGVSGAIQHMVGCKGAKQILAINTDPEAPIVARADYAIIDDLHKAIPAICVEIRKGNG
ncbi:MAG: electron transfer flavoprotein subunit alpha/FixB family protein [Caldilinea sp. CFX5]|nr:electron transfer flavoprotein subunit alpha/FixB family protein [Caldilinea sp. CFX5]